MRVPVPGSHTVLRVFSWTLRAPNLGPTLTMSLVECQKGPAWPEDSVWLHGKHPELFHEKNRTDTRRRPSWELI